tara:strand:+ start:909 stop:1136 length:228 start_codon:yes stop_codon:yes gene_type:complete
MNKSEAINLIWRVVNCHTESIDDWETDEELEAEIEHISQAMDIIYKGLGFEKVTDSRGNVYHREAVYGNKETINE